jgi:hypothetical protein
MDKPVIIGGSNRKNQYQDRNSFSGANSQPQTNQLADKQIVNSVMRASIIDQDCTLGKYSVEEILVALRAHGLIT